MVGRIGELTVERREIEFERRDFRLSRTKRFPWRRNLEEGPVEEKKTVFNYVATYNDFEREFARFLGRAPDVLRFAALGTTEQGASGTAFRVDYVKPSGAIGFYYPDWVVVHRDHSGEVNWIVETKGREYPGTEDKDHAMRDWCRRAEKATADNWWFVRSNQRDFDPVEDDVHTFGDLVSESIIRSFRRFRQRHLIKPMTLDEIREAINEGRE